MILVSSCLLGVACRYDGGSVPNVSLIRGLAGERVLPVCPEVLGGLPIPRHPARLQEGDGFSVLDGKARLVDASGRDVTSEFLLGAHKTLELARKFGVTECRLKSRSPSCGSVAHPDRPVGVTAALLMRQGFTVHELESDARS